MPEKITYKVRKMNHAHMNITLVITRELLIRQWIALRVFRFGAWILGMSTDVEIVVDGE